MTPLLNVHAAFAFAFLPVVTAAPASYKQEYCSVVATDLGNCRTPPDSFLPFAAQTSASKSANTEILEDAYSALAVLQNEYYQIGRGTWPSAIDWTAAVTETVVSGMLSTLTKSLSLIVPGTTPRVQQEQENLISSVYDQVIGYLFEQDIVAIRDEAFDDILWVVLGWIEATNFARAHDRLHFHQTNRNLNDTLPTDVHVALESLPWRGTAWISSFQSRAQTFWLLGSQGWDTTLCHGGMIWNPRLEPYKNAITNELYISASVSMYQYLANGSTANPDPTYLQAATVGYQWLLNSNMTNQQGLFVDGFHVDHSKPNNVECDQRDEMVYTYNQGVLLTGQRGLWDVTGTPSYLEDGHNLIQSVITATGWDLRTNKAIDSFNSSADLPPWRGIGRGGILEDQCDASGTCSQDSQTFKGIYFHHLNAFCRPLDGNSLKGYGSVNMDSFNRVKKAHKTACQAYLGWIQHNAQAALNTRDSRGRFGMWWGPGLFGNVNVSPSTDGINHNAANTTDYRNQGTPKNAVWGRTSRWLPGPQKGGMEKQVAPELHGLMKAQASDPNDRGRGRTVETQVGGVALLRAYWDISQLSSS
ncbi:glycoside hydrolase family 76 [Trichoderma arundinaceum]|uniref:Glycoside hydrolase family 76 n=1 Tax=Trichoderma arundinaceum TaxID=490622 RepID=A0A395NZZ6_TRIAR|nr:glycoside hydrolase family 76 [Trichoderma arundinaceum]